MSTQPQRTCPSCGHKLPEAMEFCPVCMLRKGLASGVESGEAVSDVTVKPTPDQPPKRFEHYELVRGEDKPSRARSSTGKEGATTQPRL